jgi:hypothetical protein
VEELRRWRDESAASLERNRRLRQRYLAADEPSRRALSQEWAVTGLRDIDTLIGIARRNIARYEHMIAEVQAAPESS